MEKVKALLKSRRFWTAIGGVVVVAAQETLGLDPDTTNRIVALAVACAHPHYTGLVHLSRRTILRRHGTVNPGLRSP